ncbi:MAG: thiosulfate oxidation carrier protein SoxY [Rhizobiales bacterium]|nr:thiosulfate oxidation carrier protein SoxY [Hyphomicrobiales bacterium]
MHTITRRQLLAVTAATATGLALSPNFASAKAEDAMAVLDKFTGGKAPAEGKVTLKMPEIAENGNTVPLSISVDSPMTADNYVKRVVIVAEGNPRPEVATLHFSPKSGVAEASTRMRLAKTQNVVALAEMSDGSFHMVKRQVKVTIGGCGG